MPQSVDCPEGKKELQIQPVEAGRPGCRGHGTPSQGARRWRPGRRPETAEIGSKSAGRPRCTRPLRQDRVGRGRVGRGRVGRGRVGVGVASGRRSGQGLPGGALLGWTTGVEPATSGITIRRSNQLSYAHRRKGAESRYRVSGCQRAKPLCGATFVPVRDGTSGKPAVGVALPWPPAVRQRAARPPR